MHNQNVRITYPDNPKTGIKLEAIINRELFWQMPPMTEISHFAKENKVVIPISLYKDNYYKHCINGNNPHKITINLPQGIVKSEKPFKNTRITYPSSPNQKIIIDIILGKEMKWQIPSINIMRPYLKDNKTTLIFNTYQNSNYKTKIETKETIFTATQTEKLPTFEPINSTGFIIWKPENNLIA